MSHDINISSYNIINDTSEAPPDTILIYNMIGGLGYVDRKDYNLFCRYYIESNSFPKHHTMNLAFAKYHSLILDIDFKGQFSSRDVSDYMSTYLKPTLKSLFDELPCFTYISATRPKGGLHIHLCELLISNDDYIQFCLHLQHRMNVQFSNYTVTVDIPKNFNLSTASKPTGLPYKPFNICFIDHNTEICLPLTDRNSYDNERNKIKFKNKKNNSNSIFRKLIFYKYDQIMKEVLNCMMPYVVFPGIQSQKITYQTIISDETITDYQPIGDIECENGIYKIFKSNKLNFKSLDWMAVYNYLNNYCCKIKQIKTKNEAITYWLKILKSSIVTQKDIFQDINTLIKADNYYWRNDSHPLRSIMQHNNGLYFLPIFYALCNVIDKTPYEILSYFSGIGMDKLINRLKLIDEHLLMDVSEKFTIETILYCASNVRIYDCGNTIQGHSIENKFERIIEDMKDSILVCKYKLDYETIIKKILKRYTPLIMGVYQHSSKKTAKLMWNLLVEQWQDINSEEIKYHTHMIINEIETFLYKNKKDEDESFIKVQIHQIAACLYAKANLERKDIAMDQHKFHIKTKAGILDLLTGSICATVPEFFMSNKCININFKRNEFNSLYDDPDLIHVYKTITSKQFFRTFLKYLLTDTSDDYFDTIKIVSEEFNISPQNQKYKHLHQIFNFYCHLCKYMSFEYEMVIYMLYVISSMFIATNYYRHFFVFQGNTKNGKSKFFELIGKVFGNYSHSIGSINLQTNKNSSGAQPELAASLHSTRVIFIEELSGKINENFIKILTGNSQVSCRNLYETNAGGIPTAKVFASTNNPPECTATDAFRDRVLAIPFASSFSEKAPLLTSQQVMDNVYKLDFSETIVRDSYLGMFLLAYCHLIQNFDRETGLLNLPTIPTVMVEFKEEYLKMTDIYAQFKQYVDVQIISNTKLLYSDLVSAVRKFLINTKNHLSLESTILKRFDEEFASHKQETDTGYDFNSPLNDNEDEEENNKNAVEDNGNYEADEEEEEFMNESVYSMGCIKKKLKMTIIYYQDVSIKQLKKRL